MVRLSPRRDASRRVTYGELIGGRTFGVQLDARARRKPPGEWKVLGTPAIRLDMPSMATGRFEFVHNVRVPGMLHGVVVRPPEPGATLEAVDEGSVRAMPGNVRVVTRKNFVGVVADKPWQARQAAASLKVTWSRGAGLPPQRTFYEDMRKQPSRDTLLVDSKDVDATLAKAASVIHGTYRHPYQMHGSLGASCAVADVQGGKATVWSPTQSAYPTRSGVATAAGNAGSGRTRHLHERIGLLRDQRGRHCVVRRRAALTGSRPAGSRAAFSSG